METFGAGFPRVGAVFKKSAISSAHLFRVNRIFQNLTSKFNYRSNTGNDVTGGYVQFSTERLRKPMQQITNYVLSRGGVREMGEAVELGDQARRE